MSTHTTTAFYEDDDVSQDVTVEYEYTPGHPGDDTLPASGPTVEVIGYGPVRPGGFRDHEAIEYAKEWASENKEEMIEQAIRDLSSGAVPPDE